MAEISQLAELRKLLLSMEKTMGLQDLSTTERDIFYAASDQANGHGRVTTAGIREHTLVRQISRPSFFRAMKSLVDKGFLTQGNEHTRGCYIVNYPDA